MKNTKRKLKIIGTKKFIDTDTGELEEMQVISVEERDANFYKLWVGHIIQSLDLIGNQKIKLAFWLIEQMNNENQITMTQRQMAKKSGISIDTVKRTIIALIESNFLTRYNMGVYQVNPDIIFKGGKNDRMNVLIEYVKSKEEGNSDEVQN